MGRFLGTPFLEHNKIIISHEFGLSNDIVYTLIRSARARRVRIAVHASKGVRVTAPKHISVRLVDEFVAEKAEWIRAALRTIQNKKQPWVVPIGVASEQFERSRARARKFIGERVQHFNVHYNFSYERISVKNMSSRWGSCSNKKNLNFHYRLLFLPPELADYVVVHEMCHLKEMNHTARFWALVAEQIPHYKNCRRKLSGYQN